MSGQAYAVQWSVTVSAPGAGDADGERDRVGRHRDLYGGGGGGPVRTDVDDRGCEDADRDVRGGCQLRDECGHDGPHGDRAAALRGGHDGDGERVTGTQTTAPFSTSGTGRWLVAFVAVGWSGRGGERRR